MQRIYTFIWIVRSTSPEIISLAFSQQRKPENIYPTADSIPPVFMYDFDVSNKVASQWKQKVGVSNKVAS